MSSGWDDFKDSSTVERKTKKSENEGEKVENPEDGAGCDWGFNGQNSHVNGEGELASDSNKFIPVYERYLQDKQSFNQNTKNHAMYSNNPQKVLREWFDSEGNEFAVKTDQLRETQYVCSLDLPLDDQDFTLTSEVREKEQDAVDEVCSIACRLLDESELLFTWQSDTKEDLDKKRRLFEASKDDDIELDSTNIKRHRSSGLREVNTYESLLAKWNELNMSILQLKAKLVKLDLSVTQQRKPVRGSDSKTQGSIEAEEGSDGDELDPLDEFMSNLETKTKLSIDEKIEKSRIKTQIAAYEREQDELSRLIKLAKPRFDLNKAYPTAIGTCSKPQGKE